LRIEPVLVCVWLPLVVRCGFAYMDGGKQRAKIAVLLRVAIAVLLSNKAILPFHPAESF
jgi:hypothetical protein